MDNKVINMQPRSYKPRKKVESYGKLKEPKFVKPVHEPESMDLTRCEGGYFHGRTSTDY